ncbi:hypothetical protein N431DRAFT_457142 [Stipitochalara longipes BDJ]|nr:hypothetical protein N431DRAFT_457142 [Stipitochalara longipes BDJ]
MAQPSPGNSHMSGTVHAHYWRKKYGYRRQACKRRDQRFVALDSPSPQLPKLHGYLRRRGRPEIHGCETTWDGRCSGVSNAAAMCRSLGLGGYRPLRSWSVRAPHQEFNPSKDGDAEKPAWQCRESFESRAIFSSQAESSSSPSRQQGPVSWAVQHLGIVRIIGHRTTRRGDSFASAQFIRLLKRASVRGGGRSEFRGRWIAQWIWQAEISF